MAGDREEDAKAKIRFLVEGDGRQLDSGGGDTTSQDLNLQKARNSRSVGDLMAYF